PGQPPMAMPAVPPPPGVMPVPPGMVPPQPVMPVPGAPVPGVPVQGMPVPGVPMPAAPPMPAGQPVLAAQPAYAPAPGLSPASAASVGTSRAEALTERVRKRKKIKKITNLVILGVMAVALVIGAVYVLKTPRTVDPNNVVTTDPDTPGTDPNTPVVDPDVDTGPKLVLVDDDQNTLWNSPTSGEPLTLEGLPADTRAVVSVKLAQLTASPEGTRVLQGLGPKFDAAKQSWESATGFKFEQVEQLLIGFSNATQPGQPCMVVTLKTPTNFASSWGNPAPLGNPGEQYFKVNGWAMYPLPSGEGKSFAMSSEPIIMQVASVQGEAPRNRELEQLRGFTDADRTFNLLIDPNFISAAGPQLLPGDMAGLQGELEWFFGAGIQAAYLSANMSDQLYIESRYYGTLDNEPDLLANTMRQRLSEVSKKLSVKMRSINATPYWRNLADNFPKMVQFAHTMSRSGAEDNQAIVNAVLPVNAAQNLIAASELALSADSAGAATSVATTNAPTAEPTTIPEKLKIKMSLSFPRNSLEFAMRDYGEEIGVQVKILGPDLQLDGITRNQQISDFMQEDKTREEVLIALLIKANPIKTVTEPNDPNQKLVYVIAPNPEDPDAGDIILITTRSAAATKNYTVPDIFKVSE
ncbi:MAG: hypothetical protein COA78_24445, partial [Blastopirellula sp.]